MTKEELIKKAQESPALTMKSTRKGKFAYPFGDKVPLRVRMNQKVTSDVPYPQLPNYSPICVQGSEYYVWVNSYGAVAAILENGEQLGLKPGEFEVIEWHDDKPIQVDQFIVAEVSKSWVPGSPKTDLLSQKFEMVINVNHKRGYKLSEWKMAQILAEDVFTETIIAIFEKNE
jgi:hypothetical protein